MQSEQANRELQLATLKRLLKSLPAYIRDLWEECLRRDHEVSNYRDVLLRQGDQRTHGFILLNGSVTLTKTTRNNGALRRRTLAEVSGIDILGSDCVYDSDPHHFYTYTVSSSTADCIRVNTDEISELAVLLKIESVREREHRRRGQLAKTQLSNTSSRQQFTLKQSKLELLKMELPQIKPKQPSPRRSTRSVKEKPKFFDEIIALPKPHLKFQSRTPQKSQPLAQSPDRLFKQNLKNIIRRKISYETRQFAVLKFFRKADLDTEKQSHTARRNADEPEHIVEGPINRFFNLEIIK